jgi:ribosomal protein S18 acetylase RimI-like enzyme
VFAAMTAADFDEAEKLWRDCEGVRLSALDDRPGFERFLARNPGFSQTARIGGVLAAAVLCGHDGRIGYLHHAAVAPRFRRHGLGRAIVGRCLDLLKAAGVGTVYAFVVESNQVGHDFWKSLGWTRRDVDAMQVSLLEA